MVKYYKIKMDVFRHTSRNIKSEVNGNIEQNSSNNFLDDKSVCRLCLSTKAKFNIFKKESEMIAKIQLCCALEVMRNDGLPDHICSNCIDTLEIASNFRTTCQESDKILRTNFEALDQQNYFNEAGIPDTDIKEELFFDNDALTTFSDGELIKEEYESKDKNYMNNTSTNNTNTNNTNTNGKKSSIKQKRKSKNARLKAFKKEPIETEVKILKIKAFKKSVHHNSHLCTICGRYFEKRSTYHSHIRSHTNEVFRCNECQKTFNRKTKLQEHLITHFGVKNIPCDECGKLFASRAYVQKHVDKVHKKLRVVQCNICLKQLADNHTLKYHMKTHTGEKDYECELCHKQFTFKLSLQYHMRTHTGEKPYACRYCHKRFSDTKSCLDHEMLHTGEKPYKCPICSKGFAQLSNMKSHFRYNHKGQNIKDYPSYKKRNNKADGIFVPRQIITLPVPPECKVPTVT